MTPALIDYYLGAHQKALSREFDAMARIPDPDACREINKFLIELALLRIRLRLETIACR